MIKKLVLLSVVCTNIIVAQTDSDLDGVPDNIDECPKTPFLSEVNHKGCTISILRLPDETNKKSFNAILSYGFNTNEDLKDRKVQHNSRMTLNYFKNNWAYSLQSGYYTHAKHYSMLDTSVKIRKSIKLSLRWTWNLGVGLRLPTYVFKGNQVDELFYTSLHYYPTEALSFFGGYNFIHVGDEEIAYLIPETRTENNKNHTSKEKDENAEERYEGLQNMHKIYLGAGYFFSDTFYMNLLYSIEKSKFVSEHIIRSFSTSSYYKIDDKWFTTLYYKKEVLDEDLHDNLLFSVGYNF